MRLRSSYAQWADDIATMPIEEARRIVQQMTSPSGYYNAPKKMARHAKDSEDVEILSLDELMHLESKFSE